MEGYPELVTRTATGEVQTVKYHELIPVLLNELQRQRQEFQQALRASKRNWPRCAPSWDHGRDNNLRNARHPRPQLLIRPSGTDSASHDLA
jgi:hypothetical protein